MPSETSKVFLDRSVSHQIGLIRVQTNTTQKMIALVNRVEDDIVQRMQGATDLTRARLETLLGDVRELHTDLERELREQMTGRMEDIADFEAEFQRKNILTAAGAEINRPNAATLKAAALSRPFQGKILREWTQELSASSFARLRDQVRIGFVEGEGIDRIIRRVRGTRGARFQDGVMQTTRRQAEAMVRTAVNHTATSAREEVFKANDDIINEVMWVAVLDSRTSPICQSRDGQTYPLDKGPRPPAHPNCRSTTSPVLRGESPPDKTTFGEWMKRQDKETQEDALGVTKAKLFRQGNLNIEKFTDRQDRPLTLDQLRQREDEAFRRAGLGENEN